MCAENQQEPWDQNVKRDTDSTVIPALPPATYLFPRGTINTGLTLSSAPNTRFVLHGLIDIIYSYIINSNPYEGILIFNFQSCCIFQQSSKYKNLSTHQTQTFASCSSRQGLYCSSALILVNANPNVSTFPSKGIQQKIQLTN